MKKSNRSLYVRATVTDRTGTALMRRIEIPTLLCEVPESVVNLKGFVVAGQVFWHADTKWHISRCLMCFKQNTALEMQLCDGSKTVHEDVDEVFIAPSHVVRSIRDGISEGDLKSQLTKDAGNLPLIQNSGHVLDSFIDYKKKDEVKDDIDNLAKEIKSHKDLNAKLSERISALETKLALKEVELKEYSKKRCLENHTNESVKRARVHA